MLFRSAQILQPRAQELLELIQQELCRLGVNRQIGAGVIFTGGAARLAGLCDLAEQILGMSARIGLTPQLENAPESLREPAFTTLMGLLYYAQRLRQMRQEHAPSLMSKLKTLLTGGSH